MNKLDIYSQLKNLKKNILIYSKLNFKDGVLQCLDSLNCLLNSLRNTEDEEIRKVLKHIEYVNTCYKREKT